MAHQARAIKAGISASLSGQFQTQGRQALAGLQAWAAWVNRRGGLRVARAGGGLPVEVIHYDDASRADRCQQAVQRLLDYHRVDLLFGPYSSVLTAAAAAVAESRNQVLWNQGGASERVFQQGYRWVVGILTPASEYLAGLLPAVRVAAPKASTLAVVRASTGEFPQAVVQGLERWAAALGFHTVLAQNFPADTQDFASILDAVAAAQPDVLVAVGRIHNDLAFAQQLAARRLPITVSAVVAAPIQQFCDALGQEAEGFVGPSQWEAPVRYPVDYGPGTQEALEYLAHQGDSAPDYPLVQAFAAGLVAQRCAEEAGSLEPLAMRKAAGSLEMTTFYGRFRIDPDSGRQVGRSVVLVQWQQGRKLAVWPPELRQGMLVAPWRDTRRKR